MTRPRMKDGARKELGAPRVDAASIEARAEKFSHDFDPGTPAWVREMFDAGWTEIRHDLARRMLHGWKLWEIGALVVSQFHVVASVLGNELACAIEREDIADLVEKVDAALVGKVMLAPETQELRAVVLHPLHPAWIGPVWVRGGGAR